MAESSSKLKDLKVASWNVKKITYKADKLIGILNTLSKYNVDVALLQETNLRDAFKEQYKEYTLFFPKNEEENIKSYFYGVAAAVKNELQSAFAVREVPSVVSDRIMHCTLHTNNDKCIHFINVYAPVLDQIQFYDHLQFVFSGIEDESPIFLFGDFNAHVGPGLAAPVCLGDHCVYDKPNKNGKKLIGFCEKNNLFIVNTFVRGEINEKMTYYRRNELKLNQRSEVDLLITRNNDVVSELSIYDELEYTDHCIVVSTCTFKIPNYFVETPRSMTVNRYWLVFLLSSKDVKGKNEHWNAIQRYEDLYGFCNSFQNIPDQLYNEITNAILELKVTYKHCMDSESTKLKLQTATSFINKYLDSINISDLKCTDPDIKNALLNIVSTNQENDVNTNGAEFILKWNKVTKEPSLPEIELAIKTFKKNTFLIKNIHSLVKDMWKKGHVPIELSMCIAGVFSSDDFNGEPKGNSVVNLIYDVIQYILNERLQLQAGYYISNNRKYNLSSSNKKKFTEENIKVTISSMGQSLYMTFIDFNDFENKNNFQALLRFLSSCGLPERIFDLISYFAIGLRKTNGISLAKCLLNVSVSIVFKNLKLTSRKKSKIIAVHCNDRMVLISSSAEKLKQCLNLLDQNINIDDIRPIPRPISIYFVPIVGDIVKFVSSITAEEDNRDRFEIVEL